MTIMTVDWLAREALMILQSNLVTALLMDRRYEADFTGTEARGDTVRLRRRDRGNATEFTSTITSRGLDESTIPVQLEKHYDASFEITSKELTLSLDDFSSQVLAPQIASIAELVDTYAASKLLDLPYWSGLTSAGVPAAFATTVGGFANYRKVNNDTRVPSAGRVALWGTTGEAALLGIDGFVSAEKRGDGGVALENASLGHIMGYDHFMDQNVSEAVLTAGTGTGAVVNIAGGGLVGATTIVYDGASGATVTFTAGSAIKIGTQQYTLAATSTAVSSAGTFTLKEPLRIPIADDAVITVVHAASDTFARRGALFHPRAFAFCSVPLAIPPGADGAMISAHGLAIRIVRDYVITTKKSIISLDCLVGCKMVDGNLGSQVAVE